MAYDDDVNELVKRFRYLHETDSTANRREIMRILKELERLGVIVFHPKYLYRNPNSTIYEGSKWVGNADDVIYTF